MKKTANALVYSLAVICSGAVHAATVTVPPGPNGLTSSGNSDLTFSSDLLAALDTGNVQVIGYTGSPITPGDVNLTPGIGTSPVPLVLLQPDAPTPASSLVVTDPALLDFLKSLQLLGQFGPSSVNIVAPSAPIESLPLNFVSGSGVDFGSVTLSQSAPLGLILTPGLGVSSDSFTPDVLIGSGGLGQIGSVSAASVPELETLPMMGLGLLALALLRRAKRS